MNELVRKMGEHISKELKLSFKSTFMIGIMVHLFMLSNKIPNHDDVSQLYDSMHRIASGRWFLFFPARFSSDLSLPWFNGVLGIIYISLCVMIIISLFQVKSYICIIAISAIMVTFPTVATTFNYMQAGDSYFFGLLLACTAVFFACRASKSCWLITIILLTLSLGIYQAYLPFVVALLVIWHIKKLLVEDKDSKEVLVSGLKCICAIGISVALYSMISKLLLKHQGAKIAGHIETFVIEDFSLKNIIRLVLTSYKKALWFYLFNESKVHYAGMNYLYALMFMTAIIFSVILFKRYNQKKSRLKNFLLVFLYVVLPLASGLIYCMCAQVHTLMIYGYIALLLFPLILTDQIEQSDITVEKIKDNLIHIGQVAIVIIIFITTFNYALISNKAYLSLYLTYEQSYAYANRLMTDIQIQDGYDRENKIILIGSPAINTAYTMPWLEEDMQALRGVTPSLVTQYTFTKYLRFYLGVEQEVSQITSLEKLKDLGTEIDIEKLKCYPGTGSIVCEEDTIFVKFSDVQ